MFCNPNGNKAVVIFTLLPVQHLFNGSWSHHLGKRQKGQSRTGYTFGRAKSASERVAPAPSTNWERLITISRSDLSNPGPAPEAPRQLFSPLNLTARRITARQGVFLLFHPSLFERGFTFFAQEKQPNGDAFYLERNAKSRKWFWPQRGIFFLAVWNKLSSPYAHVNVEDKKKKARAQSILCKLQVWGSWNKSHASPNGIPCH